MKLAAEPGRRRRCRRALDDPRERGSRAAIELFRRYLGVLPELTCLRRSRPSQVSAGVLRPLSGYCPTTQRSLTAVPRSTQPLTGCVHNIRPLREPVFFLVGMRPKLCWRAESLKMTALLRCKKICRSRPCSDQTFAIVQSRQMMSALFSRLYHLPFVYCEADFSKPLRPFLRRAKIGCNTHQWSIQKPCSLRGVESAAFHL